MPRCRFRGEGVFILLVFSELPGFVVCLVMLILKNSQSLLVKIFLLLLTLSPSAIPLHICYTIIV